MAQTIYGILARSARAAHRQRMAQNRASTRAHERMVREEERATRIRAAWDERERKRLYLQSREADAADQTEEIETRIGELAGLLAAALRDPPKVDFHALKTPLEAPPFEPGDLASAAAVPKRDTYLPPSLPALKRLFPGYRRGYEQAMQEAVARFDRDHAEYLGRERSRAAALRDAKDLHSRHVKDLEEQIARQHAEVERFEDDVRRGEEVGSVF